MGANQKAQVVYDLKVVSDAITRPANTTAYAANDVVSDATGDAHYEFDLAQMDSHSVTLSSLLITSSAYNATGPDLELWLFDTDVATVADNGACAFTDAELATCVGIITIPTASWNAGTATAGAGGNMAQQVTKIDLPLNVIRASATNKLYGQLVIRASYTPVSAEIFTTYLTFRMH